MKAMVRYSVLVVLFTIGLLLLVCETEDIQLMVTLKAVGGICWYYVAKLFNQWKSKKLDSMLDEVA